MIVKIRDCGRWLFIANVRKAKFGRAVLKWIPPLTDDDVGQVEAKEDFSAEAIPFNSMSFMYTCGLRGICPEECNYLVIDFTDNQPREIILYEVAFLLNEDGKTIDNLSM